MKQQRIVGLTGYAGSGKDAAADGLVAQGWTKVSFTDPMWDMLFALNPFVDLSRRKRWYSWLLNRLAGGRFLAPARVARDFFCGGDRDRLKRESQEVRRLLQVIGTDIGRSMINVNLWHQLTRDRIKKLKTNVVIPNIRYWNDAQFVRNRGGLVIRITRPGVGPLNDHPSEQQDFEVDDTIINGDTIKDLQERLCFSVERTFARRDRQAPATPQPSSHYLAPSNYMLPATYDYADREELRAKILWLCRKWSSRPVKIRLTPELERHWREAFGVPVRYPTVYGVPLEYDADRFEVVYAEPEDAG